jgi:RNA polymerase sigma factor (sigma-70 family)
MKRPLARGGASVAAIERVYETRFVDLVRVAQAMVGEVEIAKDVVHSAFVSAVTHRHEFRGEGSLEGWIFRTVVNGARDELRRSRTVPLEDARVVAVDAAGPVDRDWVRSAIAQLPERQRLVLFLRHFADLDYASIGRILEIQPGTVAATLNAAHATLHCRLGPDCPEVNDEQARYAV